MKFTTKTDTQSKLRIHTVQGALEKDSLLENLQKVYSGADFDENMNAIWDLREADLTPFSYAQIEEIGEYVGKQWGIEGQSKAAIVVSRDVDYGLTHILKMLLEARSSIKIRTFRDYQEALVWVTG
jgi:hypothetical protein